MRIEIEIPKEFEGHFESDRFEDSLTRLAADAHMAAGTYEKETAIMLIKALKSSKPAYDVDKVMDQMKRMNEEAISGFLAATSKRVKMLYSEKMKVMSQVIRIIRNGGLVEDNE